MKRPGHPRVGELVVARISKIFPNSVSAELVEYHGTGMIHVSEVAGRWVHDIREFVREKQMVVARVLSSDGQLSLKRVRPEEAQSKLNEFKRESKAEKVLEQLKLPEPELARLAAGLREGFGSLSKALELAFKNPELFTQRAPGHAEQLIAIAQKRFTAKTYELRGKLTLLSYKPDGIVAVKAALGGIEKAGLVVKYLSAPNYLVLASGKNVKELESKLVAAAQAAVRAPGISEGRFELEK